MSNGYKKIAEGLRTMAAGFDDLSENGFKGGVGVGIPVSELSVETEVEVEAAYADIVASSYSDESFAEMSFSELKQLATNLGIDATGARKILIERIKDKVASSESEEAVVPASKRASVPVSTEEAPPKKRRGRPAKNKTEDVQPPKVEKPTPVPDPVEEPDDEEEADEVDDIFRQVSEAVKDMSNDDIAAILSDIGVSPKGKREALIEKVVKAVKDKKIELDDSEDEEEADNSSDEEPEDEAELEEGNVLNFCDVDAMTDERALAVQNMRDEIQEQFDSGNIDRAALLEWLETYFGDEDDHEDVSGQSDEELQELYMQLSSLYVDDDGEIHEEDGELYYVDSTPFCCGRPLSYVSDPGDFVCEYCGAAFPESDVVKK